MDWIADASIAGLALWAALIVSGIAAGSLAAGWYRAEVSRKDELLLLGAAAAGVAAWCANAGSLIAGSSANALLAAYIPVPVEAGYRVAILWATLPGASLTFAVVLLARAAITGPPRSATRTPFLAVASGLAFVALGLALWFMPAPNASATTIPAFAQTATAALAPGLALGAIIALAQTVATGLSGADPGLALRLSWLLATLAIAAEQSARSRLGIGPGDPVVLGSASSGLALWALTSAVLHRRVQSVLFRELPPRSRLRHVQALALAAHVGAVLVVVSFAGHGVARRETIILPPGSPLTVTDAFKRSWQLANQGVSRFDADGRDVLSVAIDVRAPSGATALLTPEIREYVGPRGEHLDTPVSFRAATGGPAETMHVLLMGADSLDVASIRITFLPLPILWPAGIALLVASAIGLVAGRAPRND